ncbi:hypothetical protein Mal33_03840 [Rosistilla oblonga]|uniref:Uncharacterized protein n=1 Tax=Rosistilla oblonga TaxID=2527990 RepID=A0A518IMW1_9BACT|nr:hypothetical protein Mal33_03840 [Rosistilla oblonga]
MGSAVPGIAAQFAVEQLRAEWDETVLDHFYAGFNRV